MIICQRFTFTPHRFSSDESLLVELSDFKLMFNGFDISNLQTKVTYDSNSRLELLFKYMERSCSVFTLEAIRLMSIDCT